MPCFKTLPRSFLDRFAPHHDQLNMRQGLLKQLHVSRVLDRLDTLVEIRERGFCDRHGVSMQRFTVRLVRAPVALRSPRLVQLQRHDASLLVQPLGVHRPRRFSLRPVDEFLQRLGRYDHLVD